MPILSSGSVNVSIPVGSVLRTSAGSGSAIAAMVAPRRGQVFSISGGANSLGPWPFTVNMCLSLQSGSIDYELVGVNTPAGAGPISGVTYDGSDRISTYVQDGATFTCTYYSSGNGDGKLATVSGNGRTKTFTYNVDGLVTDEVWS